MDSKGKKITPILPDLRYFMFLPHENITIYKGTKGSHKLSFSKFLLKVSSL